MSNCKVIHWEGGTPDRKQGKCGSWSRLSANWRVGTHSPLITLASMSQVQSERGRSAGIATSSSQSQSLPAPDHLLSLSPRPGLPRSRWLSRTYASSWMGDSDKHQMQRQKSSHLITEQSRPGAGGMPLGTAPEAVQGHDQRAGLDGLPLLSFSTGVENPPLAFRSLFQSFCHSWKHSRAV